jgi:hypothetical protein
MITISRYRISAPAACRAAALAAVCVAGLSLAACSGGISTPSAAPSSPATSPASSPAAAGSTASATTPPASGATGTSGTTAPAAGSGGTVSVGGSLGTFPIPAGASVVDNGMDGSNIEIVLTGVTPQEVSTFYTAALPSSGYTITENSSASDGTVSGLTIKFTGHGYQGDIGAASGISIAGVSGLSGEDIGIELIPQ